MAKFREGETVYWLDDNLPVTILKVYDDLSESSQSYLIRHSGGMDFNEREIYLFRSNKFVEGAMHRVEEIVYSKSKWQKGKRKRQVITDVIKLENDRILYECKDENGETHLFSVDDLALYPNTIIARRADKRDKF